MSLLSIIIPVHNRCATTLRCLRQLSSTGVLGWAQVVIVDDGSTDDTAAAIAAEFPSVAIVPGNGQLWWGGAINLGMGYAIDNGASHVAWLNDDCLPRAGALEQMLRVSIENSGIAVAQTFLLEVDELGYSGMNRSPGSMLSNVSCGHGTISPCDTFAGNCVVIPTAVIERIGLIDTAVMPHTKGDVDFGLRASDAGIPCFVVGDAKCESTYGYLKNRMSWLLGEVTLRELWTMSFRSPTGGLAMPELRFWLRHFGWRGARHYVRLFARLAGVSALRLMMPHSLRMRMFAARSTAHQRMIKVKAWTGSESAQLQTPPA